MGTVAGIDYGHRSYFAGILCSPFDVVAHGYHVGIVGHHQDCIFQSLAFADARHLGIGKSYHSRTKPVSGCLEAKAGAGRGFVKQGCYDFALEKFTVGMALKLFRHVNKIENLLTRQAFYAYKIMFVHTEMLYVKFRLRSYGYFFIYLPESMKKLYLFCRVSNLNYLCCEF